MNLTATVSGWNRLFCHNSVCSVATVLLVLLISACAPGENLEGLTNAEKDAAVETTTATEIVTATANGDSELSPAVSLSESLSNTISVPEVSSSEVSEPSVETPAVDKILGTEELPEVEDTSEIEVEDTSEIVESETPELGAAVAENSQQEENAGLENSNEDSDPSEASGTVVTDSDPGDDSDFQILSVISSNVTNSSFDVEWSLSDFGTGQVHYGTVEPLEYISAEEARFKFSTHRQTISGLLPDSTYKFYVRSVNSSGIELKSETVEVITDAATVPLGSAETEVPADLAPIADWPANANGDLPLGGVFYGQQEAGLVTGNAPIAIESSRRFRAEKTGYITAVRYNNRTLLSANITGRCKVDSAPNSVWCKCVDAGLDKYTCGYTLGNSYSVGNGGSIVIEIRPDDESSVHNPSETVLGRTAGRFVPVQRANEHFPILSLENPVLLQAGKLYHLVYRNLNPPSNCKLSGVSVSEASSCPRNQGAIGLNGTYQPVLFGQSKKYGPFGGDAAGNLVRNSPSGQWSVVQEKLSWYEVGYEDGTWVGDSHTGIGSTAEGRQFIGGKKHGRQVFTVRDSTRTVDGIWVYYGYNYTYTPDGSDMSVTLKDESGVELASGTIKASPECIATAAKGYAANSFREQHCRVWEYTDFSEVVSLLEGETYSVEFSASATSGFSLHTFFPLNYGVWKSTSRNHWSDAHAEISSDYGSTWEDWAGTYYPDRDINMLFTIEGMPKQLK